MTLYKIETYKRVCMKYHKEGVTFLNPESIRDVYIPDDSGFCSVSFLNSDDYYYCKFKDIEKVLDLK